MDIDALLADLASKDAAHVERVISKLETALAKLDDSERSPIAARIAGLAKHQARQASLR